MLGADLGAYSMDAREQPGRCLGPRDGEQTRRVPGPLQKNDAFGAALK